MKEQLHTIRNQITSKLGLGFLVFSLSISTLSAQTYLKQNFEDAFVGAIPAPAGSATTIPASVDWTQTRIVLFGDGTPEGLTTAGERDWQRNTKPAAPPWSLAPTTVGTVPNAMHVGAQDSAALWFNDANSTTATCFGSRRIESPSIDISGSTSPYVRFWLYWAANSNIYNVRVVASADGGTTWNTIMNIGGNANINGAIATGTPWQRVNILIPSAYRTATAKIGFEITNGGTTTQNVFIDDVTVEEFTPTTVVSTGVGGLWNAPSTWVGGVVPTNDNHVEIAPGATVSMNVNNARVQNVTVNGLLKYNGTSATELLHAYGNLTINSGGTYEGFNSTTGKLTFVGGNVSNAGTLNISVGAGVLAWIGGAPATFTNTGTLTLSTIVNTFHLNSGGVTYNSPVTSVFTSLFDGAVNPNGNLTIGLPASSTAAATITRTNLGSFTSSPIFNFTGMTALNYTYATNNTARLSTNNITTGNEIPLIDGTPTVQGSLTMNTFVNLNLGSNVLVNGALTLTRGIIISSPSNMLTMGSSGVPALGTAPSTAAIPTTHGSYVVGPLRINFPISGTASRNIPLGIGSALNGPTVSANVRKPLVIATSTAWSGQSVTFSLEGGPTGYINAPGVSLASTRTVHLNLNGGADIPASATLQMYMNNYTNGGGANTDNIPGDLAGIRLVQALSAAGPWTVKSAASGSGAIVANTEYSRTSNAIGLLNTSGSYFAIASATGTNTYDSTFITRIDSVVAPGVTNAVILRVNVAVKGNTGTPVFNKLSLNTTGTTTNADILNANVYYTGGTNVFSTTTPFGTTAVSPSGSFDVTGTQNLASGNNYFWVTFDVSGSASITNILSANVDSLNIDGNKYTTTNPLGSGRTVSGNMVFNSVTASHADLTKIPSPSTNSQIMRIVIDMGTGLPVNLTDLNLNANGTTDTSNIRNIKVWYTGSSSTFATTSQFGTTLTYLPGLTGYDFTVSGTRALTTGLNYFWLTYDIQSGATVGNDIDAELVSIIVNANTELPIVSAPVGFREIRTAYCAAGATNAGDTDIGKVKISQNGSTIYSSGNEFPIVSNVLAVGTYTNKTNDPTINLTQATTYSIKVNQITSGATFYPAGASVFIDYNDDGDFSDVGEYLFSGAGLTSLGLPFIEGNFTVPCSAVTGTPIRLRVSLEEDIAATLSSPPPGCGTFGYGEVEDYTVIISPNPVIYNASTSIQQSGLYAPSAVDVPILRVPVKISGCGVAEATQFHFSTAGSTNATDIVAAKLYRTNTSPVFSTSTLVGSIIPSPSGVFTFNVIDTLINNDTTNYWLAYDISGSATLTNVLDARFDSIHVLGSNYTSLVSNPAGNITIDAEMTYVSSDADHPQLFSIGAGTSNNQMLKIMVVMSSMGSVTQASQFNLNTAGSISPLTNTDSVIVWYTGSNSSFSSPTFFGGVGAQSGAFSINGSQNLLNDTNYFWVTYNVPLTATLGDSLDMEITSFVIAGNPQTPSTTAPAGDRKIRVNYCIPTYTNGKTDGDLISNISIAGTTLANNSGTAQVNPAYTYFTGAPNLTATFIQGGAYNVTVTVGTWGTQGLAAWIDYNDDGVFAPTEKIGFTVGTIGSGTGGLPIPPDHTATFGIQLTCDSRPGVFRMRVRTAYGVSGASLDPCANPGLGYGEAEDYDVTILVNPLVYQSSTTIQSTGTASPTQKDKPILRIPIRTAGCDIGTATELRFKTTGTTNPADIAYAKLYKTGNSAVFSTANPIDSIASPSGSFSFLLNDTIIPNDTTNYWLAYDIAPTATPGNFVDAEVDSIELLGSWYIPTVTNPAGNWDIQPFLSFVSTTVTQANTTKIEQGTVNSVIAGLEVVMSSTGVPTTITSINMGTTGTTSLTDITNLKVWYTGTSKTFATTTQFGSTVATPAASQTVSGTQTLSADTNYFWITYDISPSAIVSNLVDAEVTSIDVHGTPELPTITAPVGSRQIRGAYCTVAYASGCGTDFIARVRLGSIDNSTGCTGPLTKYDAIPAPSFAQGTAQTITIDYGSDGNQYGRAWIDWNDDSDFDDAGEDLGIQTPANAGSNGTATITFTIPLNANLGLLRLRIRGGDDLQQSSNQACAVSNSGFGEAEDYYIDVTPAPAQTLYVWNQTSPADYNIATNWTPNRTSPNLQDQLLFNGGSSVVVNAVIAQPSVSSITVDNNTNITLNAASAVVLSVRDSLTLLSGKINNTSNMVTLSLGTDTVNTGVLTGSGSVEGSLTRWIANAVGGYTFPMITGANNRSATINYTTAPSTAGKLTVSYVTGNPGTTGLPLVDASLNLENTDTTGVWRAVASSGLAGGTFDVTLNANNVPEVNDFLETAILGRANNASAWLAVGSHVTTSGNNTAMVLQRTGISTYGEFGIAATATNPLPVTLTSFAANVKGADAILTWTTASEINNSGFEVQRSVDGRNFEKAAFVKGAGNSNKALNYSLTDAKAFAVAKSNVVYYRLKQVDFDGKYAYSQVVRVAKNAEAVNALSVYPNPYASAYSVSFTAAKEGMATIEMVDLQGKVVATKSAAIINGNNMVPMTEVTNLEAGVYFVRLTVNGETQMTKLVKN